MLFRSSGNSGVKISANPNGVAALNFTDAYQASSLGFIWAQTGTSNPYFVIGSPSTVPVNIMVNGSTIGSFGTGGLYVFGQAEVTGDIIAFYSSDINLKENITVIENALVKIKQIRGVEYDWKADHLDIYPSKDKHDVGVIAQEIEKVLPEVVTTRDDGTKAVRYEKIVPLLIESIKELSNEVERLKRVISK